VECVDEVCNALSVFSSSGPLVLELLTSLMLAGSLRSLYCTAMRFEAAFFGEQPGLPPLPRVALLAVDFDETCTASDTIGAIINTAIEATVQRSGGKILQCL
jgi:hypothetical protein